MKKAISFLLVICLMFSLITNSFAASIYPEQPSIEEAAAQLQKQFPDAVISVTDGVINVLQMSSPTQSNSLRASTYAPQGGSYRNFFPPIGFVSGSGPQPYSVVYLPKGVTDAFVSSLLDASFFDVIISTAAGAGIEAAIAAVAVKFGITLPPLAITFIVAIGSYYLLGEYDAQMALKATNSLKNGISIFRSVYAGWPTNMYYPWTSSYVSPDIYAGWNPIFYPGEYDIT